jgi:hypothetical protein
MWFRLAGAVLALTVLVGSATARTSQSGVPSDAAATAAIIYNFTRFSTWPNARFASTTSPVVLCVRQQHRLAGALSSLDGRPVGSRALSVRVTSDFDSRCHAAVIHNNDASPANLAALASDGVLTIGESPGFAAHGAIGLFTVGRQIRFEINNRVARSAGVTLSSRLLRLAAAVR